MSDCPVCGKAGVDEAASRCPQCHADLECFALLDALHEGAPTPAMPVDLPDATQTIGSPQAHASLGATGRGRRYDWQLIAVFAGLAALILVTQLLILDHRILAPLSPTLAPAPARTPVATEVVAGGIERLAGRLEAIEGGLDALLSEQARTFERATAAGERATEIAERVRGIEDHLARLSVAASRAAREAAAEDANPRVEKIDELVLHHHLGSGETLWSVAKRYYGRGQLYPVLITQNPGLGIYHRRAGILRIFADPDEATELYRRITPPGGEGRLFRYRVEPGDDWRRLAKRFLGRPGRAPELVALNPESDLIPGEQVLIALE